MTRLNTDMETARHEIARLRAAEATAMTLQHNACVQLRLAMDYLREAKAADIRLTMLEKIDRALSVVAMAEGELTPTGLVADAPCEDVIGFGDDLEANGIVAACSCGARFTDTAQIDDHVCSFADFDDTWTAEERIRSDG